MQVEVQLDEGLCGEAGITVEDGVFLHSQLERVLPQVDAVLVLKGVGVGWATNKINNFLTF